jgi:hypothetical protein
MMKAGRKMDMTELFKNEKTGLLSHTKFWSNVAYFAATLAFLNLNLFNSGAVSGVLEFIWVIYLGVVASNAIASKWISYKYSGDQERYYSNESFSRERKRSYEIDNPDE